MQASIKARFWRFFRWGAGVFCFLFIFRLIYGYVASNTSSTGDYYENYFDQVNGLRKNYATSKMKMSPTATPQPDFSTNQKYEKTAVVRTTSSEFQKDEENIRKKIDGYKAMIQYEKALGRKGDRELHLMIGVNPEKFDSFYHEIQRIGVINSMSITKVDKTNEYRQLNAQKISLEKTVASLEALKHQTGGNQELLPIYDRQLELEDKLQNLGVDLGNFNTENEFCTVKLSLYEGATAQSISFIHRVKIALQWTIHYFTYTVIGFTVLAIFVFILLLIIDKLNILGILKQ
ncbi:DUF4349 domain-containing protein [Chitinophaga sancti]|uniref:DUF4349 domain-containing protein n=1 Tax=Chitinophaga sancti TaxID=1004 RepID=A0A1K1SQD6_9BACT|nr:DUF4349 domain-containing protein [Chitinophaga sancti]WQD61049.1 DUF4349 domain-containing protein [Chitinophaga sancti]WQG86822.1 DUF4349 domain-containing protein [Chitinophaga sancti]SFW86616.1 protein of unknown function [Chitinophaga sancti]